MPDEIRAFTSSTAIVMEQIEATPDGQRRTVGFVLYPIPDGAATTFGAAELAAAIAAACMNERPVIEDTVGLIPAGRGTLGTLFAMVVTETLPNGTQRSVVTHYKVVPEEGDTTITFFAGTLADAVAAAGLGPDSDLAPEPEDGNESPPF